VHSRLTSTSLAVVGAVVLAACGDGAMAPRHGGGAPRAAPTPVADQQTSDPGTPLVGTLPGNDSRTGSGVVALGSLGAEPVLVEAVASGLLQMYPYGDMNQPPGYVDPNGIFLFTENSCRANVEVVGAGGTYVRYCDGINTNPLQETVTRYAVLYGDVSAWRTGGPQPSFGPACDGIYGDGTPTGPCYTFVGQQTVTLTPVRATLSLEASAPEVPKGTDVTFTLALTPSSKTDPMFGQVNVPMRVVGQRWVPDAAPGTTQPCGFWQPSACARAVQESGQMEVDAVVQGTPMTVRARVTVLTDSLMVAPATASAKPGIELTFTAKTKNGTPFVVQGWSYAPNPPSGTQQLTTVAACGTGKTCKVKAYESGTITVTGVVQGETTAQTATATVTVLPCPPDTTNDKRMADAGFRKGLIDAMDSAKARMPAPYDEVGGKGWVNPATGQRIALEIPGQYYTTPPPYGTSTCSYVPDHSKAPTPPPGFVYDTVEFHAHPNSPGKKNFTGCTQASGGPGGGPITKTDSVGGGTPGPSWADLGAAEFFKHYGFVIDGAYDIYRYNHPLRTDMDVYAPKPQRWRRDGKSACFTPAK
jgi:hypothetical protein